MISPNRKSKRWAVLHIWQVRLCLISTLASLIHTFLSLVLSPCPEMTLCSSRQRLHPENAEEMDWGQHQPLCSWVCSWDQSSQGFLTSTCSDFLLDYSGQNGITDYFSTRGNWELGDLGLFSASQVGQWREKSIRILTLAFLQLCSLRGQASCSLLNSWLFSNRHWGFVTWLTVFLPPFQAVSRCSFFEGFFGGCLFNAVWVPLWRGLCLIFLYPWHLTQSACHILIVGTQMLEWWNTKQTSISLMGKRLLC